MHHQGLQMRVSRDFRRVFGSSKCQIRSESSYGEHALVHFLLRWDYTKGRLLLINSMTNAWWKLRMKFMQSRVVTVSKQFRKPHLQQVG